MQGRHSTTKRPSRAGPILAAVVAVAVIVALGVYLAPRLTEKSDASGCDEEQRVSVAVPDDLTPAIRVVAAAVRRAKPCRTLSVSTVYPESSLSQISGDTVTSPTIWILDSKSRLGQLAPEVRARTELLGSAAATPIVIAVSDNASHTAPPTWRAAFESDDFVLPNPASSPAGAFAIAALSSESKGADLRPLLEEVARRQVEDEAVLNDTDFLLRQSRRLFGPVRWFPVTEQQFVALSTRRINWELAALLPESGTTVLDYPIVARRDSEPAVDAARDLVKILDTSAGTSALGEAGFRSADGKLLNAAALTPNLKILPPPANLTELLTAWSDAQTAVD